MNTVARAATHGVALAVGLAADPREDGPCEVMQRELFGEKVWQFFQEKQAEKRPTRHPLLFCAMALAARVRRGGSRVRALCRQVVPRGDCDGG